MAGYVVATLDEIPPGQRKLVEVSGRAIVIYNLGGEFFALNNRCPHRGGGLFHGIQTCLVESKEPGHYCHSRRGEMVKCPWHGWEFDIRTGKSWCDPRASVSGNIRCRSGPDRADGGPSGGNFPGAGRDNYVAVEAAKRKTPSTSQ
jgi:3-phenylpropionate/trans-cinnamate dioxygenase ferredoxin subunit